MTEEVHIAEYDPRWPALYEQERAALALALGPLALDIQHAGSTSVPGLAAKPIIDIAVAIEEYPLPTAAIDAVVALGYEHMGEFGIPRRHYFRKGSPRSHHVHIVELANPEWENFVIFRDYLRTHPQALSQYEALKRELAQTHRHNRELYTESKSPFIRQAIERAKERREKYG